MSDLIEDELRAAFEHKARELPAEVNTRLNAFPYPQAGRRPVRWQLLTTGLAAAVAVVVVAVVSLSSGTTVALAGWTAVPARVSGASLAAAREACENVKSTQVLAAESRGPFVAIVFIRAAAPWQCITRGSRVLLKQTTRYPARLYSTVPAGKITTPSLVQHAYAASAKRRIVELNKAEGRILRDRRHHRSHFQRDVRETAKLGREIEAVRTGPKALISLTGTAGKGVTGIQFVLADGQTVSATVQDGWYEAWWPGSSNEAATYAVGVKVTTLSGTRSSKMAYGALIEGGASKGCAAGALCSVWAPTVLKQGVAVALRTNFAFFGNTRATPMSAAPRLLRMRAGSPVSGSLGIDNAQAREVTLPGGSAIWIVPGAEGVCDLFTTSISGGGSVAVEGCTDIKGALRWGEFGVSYPGTYVLSGLVPNGNKSVMVRMASGATRTVPVHDNIVYAHLPGPARSVTFKNAFGVVKHYPAS